MLTNSANVKQKPWGTILFLVLFPLVMIPLSYVDQEWTYWLNKHQADWFGEIMKRTFFQGWKFGASDPAIVYQLLILTFYFVYSKRSQNETLRTLRPFLGFVFFSSLVTGLGLVHSFKWVVGRARPNLVLNDGLTYSDWYEFGHHFVSDGIFYGSFPSGHTATVFLLITISYYLVAVPGRTTAQKILGVGWGFLVLVNTVLMIVGRSMTLHHWLTDSVGITLMSWFSTHIIFFHVLKVPQQVDYYQKNGNYPDIARYWELQLLWRLFFLTVSIMAVIIGVRSLFIAKAIWLSLLVVPGLLSTYWFGKNLNRAYHQIISPFIRNRK